MLDTVVVMTSDPCASGSLLVIKRVRSINSTYWPLYQRVTVASLASSYTAVVLRNPLPKTHAATAPLRGAVMYKALGR